MSVCRSVVQDFPANELAPIQSRRGRTARLLWVALGLLLSWLAIAYLLPQDLRKTSLAYGFLVYIGFVARVLHFHLAIAGGAIALLALILRERKLAGITGIVSLVLFWPTLVSMLPKSPPAPASPSLRIMSMNVLAFNRNGDAILEQIRAANPELIAIQEYTPFTDELLQRELSDYPYRVTDPDPISTGGMAMFSKIPMQAKVQHLDDRLAWRTQIRAALKVGGRDVVLYSIHPASPSFIDSVINTRLQTADLIEDLQEEVQPVIVAGDFNATDSTANLAAFRNMGLSSTHDLAGFGRGTTWPSTGPLKYLPGFRIDHILVSREFTCTHSEVCGETGSDHRPIVADIALR